MIVKCQVASKHMIIWLLHKQHVWSDDICCLAMSEWWKNPWNTVLTLMPNVALFCKLPNSNAVTASCVGITRLWTKRYNQLEYVSVGQTTFRDKQSFTHNYVWLSHSTSVRFTLTFLKSIIMSHDSLSRPEMKNMKWMYPDCAKQHVMIGPREAPKLFHKLWGLIPTKVVSLEVKLGDSGGWYKELSICKSKAVIPGSCIMLFGVCVHQQIHCVNVLFWIKIRCYSLAL